MNKYKFYVSNHLSKPVIYKPIRDKIDDFCYITYPISIIDGVNNLEIDLSKDNIFNLNIFFSEYAQLYYAWKHDDLSQIDYVGHFHYRRVFNTFVYDRFDDLLKEHDVITYHPKLNSDGNIIHESIGIEFERVFEKVVPNLKNILSKHNVDINDLYTTDGLYQCTVFVMSKEKFYEYCEWVFPILIDIARDLNLNLNQINDNSYDIINNYKIDLYTNYVDVKRELVTFAPDEWIKEYADSLIIPRLGGCIGEQLTSYFISKNFTNHYYEDCWFYDTNNK